MLEQMLMESTVTRARSLTLRADAAADSGARLHEQAVLARFDNDT